ncbi:methionine ABC transporter ATP-binding protein [Nigerium massiliense]|uniref:methionine ABC transporter ATP-binding protein n=1 Tax=Nigerium massiliense TaxID=1522317 RepID=UPI0005916D84|nr:ATP-binding cassette domain-containing protein [Nigerium massiliense]
MIVVDSVSKVYKTKTSTVTAVDDVSLSIASGEIFGILGRSGAGKTTLLRCLNFLERPTSGRILVDGVDFTALSATKLRSARQKIGTVFQHFNLLSSRTAADNIAFPLEITGVPKKQRDARVAELLELVGLADRGASFPSQLSGGQKQRVGIARGLAASPSVLLFDEATSALDPATTEQILDLVKNINQATGVTVVLITHESEVVRRICDSAALMEAGRVVENGHLLDVLARPDSRLAEILLPVSGPTPPVGRVLTMSFAQADAGEPLLSHLTRDLDVDVSILGGTMETVAGHKVGRLRVALTKPKDYVDDRLVEQYLTERNVGVSWA